MTESSERLYRRVAGYHDIRLDGISDIILRAPGASVLDIGCNRGHVAWEFAHNGAALVHGCDIYAEGIATAQHNFADFRFVESRFEVVDLTQPDALHVYGDMQYDIVVMLATYHKLAKQMEEGALRSLMHAVAARTKRYFAWRGTSYRHDDNESEILALDRDLVGMKRVHTSHLSKSLGAAAIWERQ